MLKNIAKKTLAAALLASVGFAAVAQERVYVIDQRDVVAKSGFDLCWRTGYWTPAAAAADKAGCECDKDLIPADVCAGKAAPAAAPAAAAPLAAATAPLAAPLAAAPAAASPLATAPAAVAAAAPAAQAIPGVVPGIMSLTSLAPVITSGLP